MGTTPTYAFRYPEPDDVDDVPTDIHELALDVENKLKTFTVVPSYAGTYAARPAANTVAVGVVYFATDTLGAWRSDGTNWVLVEHGAPAITVAQFGGPPWTGNQYDSMRVRLIVDATLGLEWHLVHRAASASPWKWEFIGGAALGSEVATLQNTTLTSFADLPSGTVGPTVTVPRGGDYEIAFGVYSYNANTGVGNIMAPQFGAAGALDADGIIGQGQTPTSASRQYRKTLATNDAVTLKYRVGGGTGSFGNRWLRVTPYRIN